MKQAIASCSCKSQKRMAVKMVLKQSVINSFDTTVPTILVGGTTTGKGGTYDWIKACIKTNKIWSLTRASKGISNHILSGVTDVQKQADGLWKQLMDDPEVNKWPLASLQICHDSLMLWLLGWIRPTMR